MLALHQETFNDFVDFQCRCCSAASATDAQQKQRNVWDMLRRHPFARRRVFNQAYAKWQAEGPLTDFFDWLIANADELFLVAERVLAFVLKIIPLFI